MLFSTQRFSEVYALSQSLFQQHAAPRCEILCNLILRLIGKHFPNCFPLEQRDRLLDHLNEKVVGASPEDQAWLVSVLNNFAEIPDFTRSCTYLLGWCYLNGVGVVKEKKEAVLLLTRSAQQGHSGAQYNLGECYYTGDGVVKDLHEAARLLTLSAQQGHSGAQFHLGACYLNGDGVVKDLREAVRLFTLAAQQGHSGAQYNLGVCYRFGDGVVKDPKEAVRYFTLSSQQGNSHFSLVWTKAHLYSTPKQRL